jgi:hypothetical protein
MLVDLSAVPVGRHPDDELAKLRFVLLSGSRETDIRGWYEQDKIMGIIFTEVTSVDKASIEHILKKVNDTICDCADMEWAKKIKLAIHVFPEENGHSPVENGMFNTTLYPDPAQTILSMPCSSSLKKIMDFFWKPVHSYFFQPVVSDPCGGGQADVPGSCPLQAGASGTERRDLHLSEIPVHVHRL